MSTPALPLYPELYPPLVVLTVTAEEQRERILERAKSQYGSERGGGSSTQTPDALEGVVAEARQLLEEEPDQIPGPASTRAR